MTISICLFDSLKSTLPALYGVDLKGLVDLFDRQPKVVSKEQRGPFFSMAIYKPDTRRAKENVEALSGLVLDIDNTEDGQIKLQDFLFQLRSLKLIHLYYTTWSHSQDRHRFRCIFPFKKPLPTSFWQDAHERVLNALGNSQGVDEAASRDVSRMWIMPCKREGGLFEFGYDLAGQFLDPNALTPVPKKEIARGTSPQLRGAPTHEEVVEALNSIDADCAYNTWLNIGMALHHQLAEAGFWVWDTWSRKGQKYKGEEDLKKHWSGFIAGKGITAATLFGVAKEYGWKQQQATLSPPSYDIVIKNQATSVEDNEGETEAEAFIDPQEMCLNELAPFDVGDIFDLPCPILKSLYEWIQKSAPMPQALYSLSASLSLLAFCKKNVVSDSGLRSNLYILTMGPSRSGKNNGLSCIHKVLEGLGFGDMEISAFGSAQGLMKHLSEKDGNAYWVQDEISHVFRRFQNQNAAGFETQLEQKILTLYNCLYQTTDRTKAEKVVAVTNPFLNIFGTSTETLIDHLKPEAATSGLLARFLVFWLRPEKIPEHNLNIDRKIPINLLESLRNITQHFRTASLDDRAQEWFNGFCTRTRRLQLNLYQRGARVDSLVGNLPEQTIKVALLVAKGSTICIKTGDCSAEYDASLTIGLREIQWAASVVIHCFRNNLLMAGLLTENKNESHINKMLDYLSKQKGKWVRRYDLCMCLRYAIKARQLDELLEPLVESFKLLKKSSPRGGGVLYCLNKNGQ